MPDGATFIGQTFYGSIGYTVGATLGASMAAQDRRTVLFVGDGSFPSYVPGPVDDDPEPSQADHLSHQ